MKIWRKHPPNSFLKQKKHFDQENYWESARDLIILMDFHPNFSQADKVVFNLGECLFEIGLYEGSSKLYKYLVKKFISSPLLPQALLGLQRIEYVSGDFPRCIEFYKAIFRSSPEKAILDVSRYYAGLSYSKIKNHPEAIKILSQIDASCPYYDHALYSIGLSYLRMRKVRQSIKTFRKVTHLTVTSDARRAVIDEAYLTLGYIYYELGYYKNALHQFRAVSDDHGKYTDALLAAGWAAAKLESYEEAIMPLTTLISEYPENSNNEEAFFLLGRCYLKLEKYEEALTVYEHLIDVFPERDVIPQLSKQVHLSLAQESIKIEKIKMDLLVLETRLLDTLPLDMEKNLPDYIQHEKLKISDTRGGMLERIKEERHVFDLLSSQINNLKSSILLKENRRDWRAFAEYGKSRALFLQRTK